jgi:hypothetical protein
MMRIEFAVVGAFFLGITVTCISGNFIREYGKWLSKTFKITLEFSLGLAIAAVLCLVVFVAAPDANGTREAGIILSAILLAVQFGSGIFFWLVEYERPAR